MRICFSKKFFEGWSNEKVYDYLESVMLTNDYSIHYYSLEGMDFNECLVYLN